MTSSWKNIKRKTFVLSRSKVIDRVYHMTSKGYLRSSYIKVYGTIFTLGINMAVLTNTSFDLR